MLVNSFYYQRGGDCANVLWLEQALLHRGVEVAVFSMRHPENLPSAWSEYWPENVEYRGEIPAGRRARAALRSVASPEVARRLERMLRDFRPDVVHLHSIHHHLTLSMLPVLERYGARVVWTLHDYRTVCPSTHLLLHGRPCERCAGRAYWHALPRRCKSGSAGRTAAVVAESYWTRWRRRLELVDVVVCPSEFQARTVRRMGLRARRVVVLPNPLVAPTTPDSGAEPLPGPLLEEDASRAGADAERAAPGLDGRHGGALYVGRLSEEKGPRLLVDLWPRMGGLPLTVLGDGPQEQELRAAAAASGAPVTFAGRVPPAEVLARMRAAQVLCVPSVCYESGPGVVLEAMAAGLPVVAHDRGGLPELAGGGCGTLVPPGDADAWVRAVTEAASGSPAVRARTQAALRRVAWRHDPERFVESLLSVYAGS